MQKEMLRKIALNTHNKTHKTNQTTVTATAQLARIILIILTILMLLQITGIPISALLAVGSIGTLTVGFAAKDTLENYMGGAMIFFDRPFGVGDSIRLPEENIEGYVENIGWRLTKIVGFDKKPYYIPNKLFSTGVIENASRMTHRRINKVIGLRYRDIDKIEPIVQAIESMLATHPDLDSQTSTFVSLTDFGDSSLTILVNAYSSVTLWVPFQKVQQDVLLKIAAIIHELGAECAFPTRTLDFPDSNQFFSSPT
jgi:MscS family membrane protein